MTITTRTHDRAVPGIVTSIAAKPATDPAGDDEPTTPAPTGPTPRTFSADRWVMAGLSVALWAALVGIGRAWGLLLHDAGVRITLFTPPVLGGYRTALPDRFGWAVAVAALGVVALPTLAERLSWRWLVGTSMVASGLWWVALAQLDGWAGFTRGLEWGREWAPGVEAAAADPFGVLRHYVEQLPTQSVQVRGHPPGFLLLAGFAQRLGLGGEAATAVLVLLAGLTVPIAVLATVRRVVDEDAARRVAPFLVLLPAALWFATSLDTLYVAVTAWFVWALIAAMTTSGRRADLLAVGAGLLAAGAVLLSYGMVLIGFVPLFAAIHFRRWRPLVVAAAVALAAVIALVPLGYWWPAGLEATRHEYDTLDVQRPYHYFVVGNLAAWGLALGPAVVAGLVLLRDRRAWVLAGGGLAAALAANLSGLSEGEVERIWLPFTVWVVVATAGLDLGRRARRGALALQAATALVVTAVIATYW